MKRTHPWLMTSIVMSTVAAAGCANTTIVVADAAADVVTVDAVAVADVVTPPAIAQAVVQTNLVADQSGVAMNTDPLLVNAWGAAFNPSGLAWVSDNGTGNATVYNSAGVRQLAVSIPPPTGSTATAAPTGQVFNPNTGTFGGDLFIFVTEDGTISGWQPSDGTKAMLRVDNSAMATVYKGLTMGQVSGQPRLYAADFRNARVDMFDQNYNPIVASGAFTDSSLPANFAPFNVLALNTGVLVSYALQSLPEKHDDQAGVGNGFIDLYDLQGNLLQRVISGGVLNSPWGMVVAPAGFGSIAGDLIVGNFGDGHVNVWNINLMSLPATATLMGAIGNNSTKTPLVIDGLWSLVVPPAAGGFTSNSLIFTAGPNMEMHGLFGTLTIP